MSKKDKKDKKDKKGKKDKNVEQSSGSDVLLDLRDNEKQLLPAIVQMADDSGRLNYLISGVRVSYPHLYREPVINGNQDKKQVKIIFDDENERDMAIVDALQAVFTEMGVERFGEDDLPEQSEWALRKKKGQWSLNAKTDTVLEVWGLDGVTPLRETSTNAEGQIYAGCYCNVKIVPWCQDNQYGQRINCQLIAIQKHSDGEPLDGKTSSASDLKKGFGAMPSAQSDQDAGSPSKHGL